ncbi:hypothetical protein KEM55_002244 [Ascosphaera atra]|nr:hypothetical protein KEM55_002244 [Ascosphaera atra]
MLTVSNRSHNGSHSSIAIANEGINTQPALILPRDQDFASGEPEPDICQDASAPADAGVRGLNHGAQVVPTLTPPEASVSLSLTTVTSTSTHVVWITENANTPEATPAGVAPSVPAVPAPITTESSLTFPFYTASEYSPPWSCMTAPEVTYIQKTVTLTLPAPETATATTTVTATEAIENVVTSYVTEYLTQTQTQTGAPPTVTATETVTRDVTAVNEVTVTVNQTVIVTATATSNATVTVTGAPITVTSVSVSIGSSSVASTSSSKFTPTVPFASYSGEFLLGDACFELSGNS